MLLGPPASGKGTQGPRLAAFLGVPHVSSGHLIRDSMEAGDPHGIADLVVGGRLVPDAVVEALLAPALGPGFILDGFPRTAAQAARLDAMLDERGLSLDAALEIDVDDGALVARMAWRAGTEGRPDDVPEVFLLRLADYRAEIPALRAHYRERLVRLDGAGSPDEVFDRVLSALGLG